MSDPTPNDAPPETPRGLVDPRPLHPGPDDADALILDGDAQATDETPNANAAQPPPSKPAVGLVDPRSEVPEPDMGI